MFHRKATVIVHDKPEPNRWRSSMNSGLSRYLMDFALLLAFMF